MRGPQQAIVSGVGLAVRTGSRGRGVFATRAFAKGETVETCPTLQLPPGTGTDIADYLFEASARGKSLVALGYGSLYNHSSDPNVDYHQPAADRLCFVALRDVQAGEELTIDYGDEWWSERGLEPE
jgi:hypothetical protein